MLSALAQAWRAWASARSLAALAVVALAVGIGSATAIFTVVNGVLLKPLPYAEPHRFVVLHSASFSQPDQRGAHKFPDLIQYEQRLQSFDAFGWFRPASFSLAFAGEPQHVTGAAVTPSLARSLGVDPLIGTWFEDDTGIVISHGLWRRIGSNPAIVGQLVTLDGRPRTVTGIMPPAFRLPVSGPGVEGVEGDVWIRLDPLGKGQNPYEGFNFAYGRLKPGVPFTQAEADAKRVAAEIAALDPAGHPSYTAKVDSLRETVILEIKPTLQLLAVAAGVLLLITCADVAGLMLTRSISRARETAIRVALGATRRQLALHYFFEGLVVAVAGAAGGILLSVALVRSVLSIAADHVPRAGDISLDPRVALFALGTSLVASVATSLAPLWQATRMMPSAALNEGVRASASARSRRLSRSLVVAELALAFVLLTTSAVVIAHLWSLRRVPPGFDPNGLLTFEMALRENEGDSASARVVAHERLTSALESIPGVTSAAFSNELPLAGCCFSTVMFAEGRPVRLEEVERTNLVTVTPGFFRTLAIPLRSGRLLDSGDTGREPLRVLVNEAAVRANWPAQNAVGAHGRLGAPDGTRFQIVGVVADIRNDSLGKPVVPALYLLSAVLPLQPVTFFVRSPLPPQTLVPEIRKKIADVDPTRPIYYVAAMPDVVSRSMSLPRVGSFMTGFFALAALLMATLGIYGVVSYGVRQATVEIGTRMALGAVGRDLLRMIVGGGLKMAAFGIVLGGIVMIGAGWMVVRLFEIPRVGVLPVVTSAVIVALVAGGASFFPAWRATTVPPMAAIRNDVGSEWRLTRDSLFAAFARVSGAASPDPARAPARDVVTEFVAAARGASSYLEAFDAALATLRRLMRATTVRLLEKTGDEYRQIAASFDDGGLDALTIPAEGFLVRRLRWYTQALPLSEGTLDSLVAWASDRRSTGGELRHLADARVRMAVALRTRDEIVGLLLLGAPADRGEYTANDRHVLAQCADHLTLMIENARLTGRVVAQEKLRRDVALAAEVQRRLLPERPPEPATAALAAMSLPARTVGGDYYDFLDLGDHRIGIALADVAGKGVAAALIMAVVQATLRIVAAERGTSLPALAAKLNEFLHRSTRSNSYATFFYAQLDERSRELRYVNAGHNPPYLVRPADGGAGDPSSGATEIFELNVGGTVLGLFPEMAYQEAVVDLRSGDVLVAFTDGVTEALNASDEEFGEARLKALLQGAAHLSAAEISAQIASELRSWIRSTDQYDDLTFVVLKVH